MGHSITVGHAAGLLPVQKVTIVSDAAFLAPLLACAEVLGAALLDTGGRVLQAVGGTECGWAKVKCARGVRVGMV